MKQSKEDITIELAKIRDSHAEWVAGDLTRRKEFARAFGWNKPQKMYDYAKELYEPTWTEIFVELGKLLAGRDFRDYEGNVSELECRIESLEKKTSSGEVKEINKKL